LHKENLNQHWTLLLLPFTNDHYVEASLKWWIPTGGVTLFRESHCRI